MYKMAVIGKDVSKSDSAKMHTFDFEGLEETLDKLGNVPVYFTVDLDVMDPSVFPGTGTPEPGGVTFDQLRKAATLVCQKANVVACDINELSPHYDSSGISAMAACKVMREMLLALEKYTKWKVFNVIPPLVWLYVLNMVFCTLGLYNSDGVSAAYSALKNNLLYAMIFVMLLRCDFRKLAKLGGRMIAIFLGCSLTLAIGFFVGYPHPGRAFLFPFATEYGMLLEKELMSWTACA